MSISTTSLDLSVARLSGTPEYSLSVWVPLADAAKIPVLVAICFDTDALSGVPLRADMTYPLVATATFGAKDGLTTQRVASLSARMPIATFHLTTTLVATNKCSVLSRWTVAYRNGGEVSRFCDVEGEGGGCSDGGGGALPENWIQCLAKRELEYAHDTYKPFDAHWKYLKDPDADFCAYDVLMDVLTDEERVECEARESELLAQAKAEARERVLERITRLLRDE
jgi:hypothetical protein